MIDCTAEMQVHSLKGSSGTCASKISDS